MGGAELRYTLAAELAYAGDPRNSAEEKLRPGAGNQDAPADAEDVTDQLALGKRLHYLLDRNGRLTIKDLLKSRDLNGRKSGQSTGYGRALCGMQAGDAPSATPHASAAQRWPPSA